MKIAVKDTYWHGPGLKLHVIRPLKSGEVLPPGVVIYKPNARALFDWELAQAAYWERHYSLFFPCPVREEYDANGNGSFVRLSP